MKTPNLNFMTTPFDIITVIPRKVFGLGCFHMAQLMTHTTFKHYRLP